VLHLPPYGRYLKPCKLLFQHLKNHILRAIPPKWTHSTMSEAVNHFLEVDAPRELSAFFNARAGVKELLVSRLLQNTINYDWEKKGYIKVSSCVLNDAVGAVGTPKSIQSKLVFLHFVHLRPVLACLSAVSVRTVGSHGRMPSLESSSSSWLPSGLTCSSKLRRRGGQQPCGGVPGDTTVTSDSLLRGRCDEGTSKRCALYRHVCKAARNQTENWNKTKQFLLHEI